MHAGGWCRGWRLFPKEQLNSWLMERGCSPRYSFPAWSVTHNDIYSYSEGPRRAVMQPFQYIECLALIPIKTSYVRHHPLCETIRRKLYYVYVLTPQMIKSLKKTMSPVLSDISIEWLFPETKEVLLSPVGNTFLFPGDSLIGYSVVCDTTRYHNNPKSVRHLLKGNN